MVVRGRSTASRWQREAGSGLRTVSTEDQTSDSERADIKRLRRSRRLRQVASFEEVSAVKGPRLELDAVGEGVAALA